MNSPDAEEPQARATEILSRARALHEQGALREARRLYLDVLAAAPGHAEALYHLASLARQMGRPDVAARRLEEALQHHPGFIEARLLLGNVLVEQRELAEAEQTYRAALDQAPDDAGLHLNLGNLLHEVGRDAEAEPLLRRAARLDPALAEAHNSLALLLQRQGRAREALECYRSAVAKRPAYAAAPNNLGTLYRELGQLDEAVAQYRAALDQGESLETRSNLAALLERANRLDEAAVEAERALSLDPRDPAARVTLAKLRSRRGDAEAARRDYQALLADLGQPSDERQLRTAARAHADLGKLEEEAGNYDRAFDHYNRANQLNCGATPGWETEAEAYLAWVGSLRAGVEALSPAAPEPGRPEEPAPIFLVGFPRSGTTLLAQALAALPGAVLMDEKTALDEARLAHLGDGGPEALTTLSEETRQSIRRSYWAAAESHLAAPLEGHRLIDKMPLNLLNLWLIAAVFPQAKVLVSLRDPRDVCLSCFTTLFRLRAGTADFPSLEHTVRLYGAVMDLWLAERRHLALQTLVHRYEDLVEDFEGEIRRIVAFLGLDWDDAALDHAASARRRFVVSPSYDQVVRPLYGSSIGRWRHFRGQLEPRMTPLRPFLDAFGYGAR